MFSIFATAAPSPAEQLATGKGYYYGTDREQHSGFACFWLKSAKEAGADSAAFMRPACDDAERKGYDPDYLGDLAREYQRTGKAPTDDQLAPRAIQNYDGMQPAGQPAVADVPAPKFDATNTSYRESDAYSRVPIEVQMEMAEQQAAQQQAQQQSAQSAQMEELISLQQEQIRMQRDQIDAQAAAAEEQRLQDKRQRIRDDFSRKMEMQNPRSDIEGSHRDCTGTVDQFGRITADCR